MNLPDGARILLDAVRPSRGRSNCAARVYSLVSASRGPQLLRRFRGTRRPAVVDGRPLLSTHLRAETSTHSPALITRPAPYSFAPRTRRRTVRGSSRTYRRRISTRRGITPWCQVRGGIRAFGLRRRASRRLSVPPHLPPGCHTVYGNSTPHAIAEMARCPHRGVSTCFGGAEEALEGKRHPL